MSRGEERGVNHFLLNDPERETVKEDIEAAHMGLVCGGDAVQHPDQTPLCRMCLLTAIERN